MKLIRYTNPQNQAASAFNRLFDLGAPRIGSFGSFFDEFFAPPSGHTQAAVDFYEDEHSYFARFELPGVSKDKVDLELENAVLSITSQESSEDDSKLSRTRFERSISVPDGVDLDEISAAMQDGILTVTMPKAENSKPRQISVK